MYHRISEIPEQQDRRHLAVSPREFEWQMCYLRRAGYTCLRLSDVARDFATEHRQSHRTFALTFDDGYTDFYAHAYPILYRYGFTATVFLVAERVGLRSNWEGQDGDSAADLLSWDQIRQLAKWGIDFGSHTLTHPRLTRLNGHGAMREISHSKSIIESQLGCGIDLFSYPFGASNERLQQIVSESGYAAAFGVDRGRSGPFNRWRIQCQSHESFWSFYWKTHGWHQRVTWLREQSPVGNLLRGIVRPFQHGFTLNPESRVGRPHTIRGIVDD
jgi:peptidoglycan/xylan/chitin deacetylase (PgdA/CDA1 family)